MRRSSGGLTVGLIGVGFLLDIVDAIRAGRARNER
jgi:hypothetical protein